MISPAAAAAIAAVSEMTSAGNTIAVGTGAPPAAWERMPCIASCRPTTTGGSAVRWTRIFSRGARAWAVPVMTAVPSWFVHTQCSVTSPVDGVLPVTVSVAVIVSPRATGGRKRKSCPR